MPSSTLTWSAPYKGTAPATSNIASTWAKLIETLQAADDASDFPWVVCSLDDASASTRYITLKPKSGAAGRILFLYAVSTTDGAWNTAIQYTTASPNSALSCAYVAGATSDTPANLRGGSSLPIFTGQDSLLTTPIAPLNTSSSLSTSNAWEVVASEDCIYAYSVPVSDASGISAPVFGVGALLVDFLDVAHNATMFLSNAGSWVPSSSVGLSGIHHRHTENGTVEHWGTAYSWESTLQSARGRDNANKQVYFCRQQLGSYQAVTNAETYRYELRQVGFGVTPLASREVLSNGSTVYARPMGGGTALTWWACNFKLNV